MSILVTGATGNVGREVVRYLQEQQASFRVAAHNTNKARQQLGEALDIVPFDFTNPDTYAQAFEGIDALFLVRPPALANVQRDVAPAIWAAVGAGVKHIVFLSIQGVEQNRMVPHYKIEQVILQTGATYTFLRAGFFMQNLSTTHRAEIRDDNEVALPVGDAKTSFIDVRDIAAVAAHALTETAPKSHTYTLTGAEALDYHIIAEKLSHVLGRTIRYEKLSVIAFFRRQLAHGSNWRFALVVTALYTITRFGNAADVSKDVASILGREPISFDQFAEDYRDCWLPDATS